MYCNWNLRTFSNLCWKLGERNAARSALITVCARAFDQHSGSVTHTHTHGQHDQRVKSKGERHIRLVSSHCLPSSFRLMTADCGKAGPNGGIPSLHEGDQGPTMISATHRTAVTEEGEPHFREMATL
jgi:hypothetical protein